MSTKPCPHCASPVPSQARFCGQCGATFEPNAPPEPVKRVATTLDEATGAPGSMPRPHAGLPTAVGQAVAPSPSPGLGPAASPGRGPARPEIAPNPVVRAGIPTAVGHAVTPALAPPLATNDRLSVPQPANLGKTLFDPSPYGASQPVSDDRGSTRPTAPQEVSVATLPPGEIAAGSGAETKRPLGSAVSAPIASEQAQEERDRLSPRRPPTSGLSKTLVLGGVNAADILPPDALGSTAAAPLPASPVGAAPRPAPAPPTLPTTSPLSQSVFAPTSRAPAAAGGPHALPEPAKSADVPASPSLAASGDKRTMLGMPAVDLAPKAAPAELPKPHDFPPAMKTMMGVAIPGIAPTHEAPPPSRPLGTLMGVAAPAIAPLRAGQAAPGHGAAAAGPHVTPSTPPIVPPPAPLVMEPLPVAPRAPAKRGVSAVVVVAIVFVVVALIGTGATLLILRGGGVLTAQPQLDETGKETLRIQCPTCPDGTVITLGASSAAVTTAAALLPLPAPLSIGDNDLEMKIDRPAAGRDETVKVHVPVAYRVKADLTSLTSSPPAITVRVEAKPGTDVTVEGKPVSLDAAGRGFHAIDVTAEIEGPSDDQKAIDRKIPFEIKVRKDRPAETGQLAVRTGIVPLHVDAPGRLLYTDRKVAAVAGQTRAGAALTVDGQSVPIDAQGRFGVRVELPAEGDKDLTIVANAPPLAPRTVRVKVTRTATLDAAAEGLLAKSPAVFDAFSSDPGASVGKLVVLDGEILEIRAGQGHTVLLVEEKKSCSSSAACIGRIVHGEEVTAARGDSVRAYGRLVGTVTAGGKTVPDIEGSLLQTRPRASKR